MYSWMEHPHANEANVVWRPRGLAQTRGVVRLTLSLSEVSSSCTTTVVSGWARLLSGETFIFHLLKL